MKIEIRKQGPRAYYDEMVYIMNNYIRFRSNPVRPARSVTGYMAIRIIGFFLVALVALYLAIHNHDMIYMAITGVMAIAVVAVYISYLGSRKKVNTLMDEDRGRTVEFTEDGITADDGIKKISYKWDEVSCVVYNKRTRTVLPKKGSDEGFMFMDIAYKEQVTEAMKEAQHAFLIEDNFEKAE